MLTQRTSQEWPGAGEQAAFLVKRTILRAIEKNGDVGLEVEAQVQRALDLLRSLRGDAERLGRIEAISCTLHKMHIARREGRCNAYASTLIRLRRTVEAL